MNNIDFNDDESDQALQPSDKFKNLLPQVNPKLRATVEKALVSLDSLSSQANQMHQYLEGLKQDYKMLKKHAGKLTREQGEEIAKLQSQLGENWLTN